MAFSLYNMEEGAIFLYIPERNLSEFELGKGVFNNIFIKLTYKSLSFRIFVFEYKQLSV